MPVNSLPPTRSQADVSLASTMPTPVPPEKKFSSHVYDELKNLDNLLAYLEESPHKNGYCSGLMKPDTHLGENARQIEVSDDQTTPLLYS
ncbi:hypothetical protein, partial [Pseudomonas grimontii]|uniref:hypothetical protein n=1 Tax=Pseudomonas grimontii TaxID=129847 RepID=UPI0021685A62